MKTIQLTRGNQTYAVEVEEVGGQFRVRLPRQPGSVDVRASHRGALSLLDNGRSFEVSARFEDGEVVVELDGERFRFTLEGERGSNAPQGRLSRGTAEVRAPMPGKVVKVLVSRNDTVHQGQGVLLFEAMKMQNEIKSPLTGLLIDMNVHEGQVVDSRNKLFSVKGGD